MPSIAKRLFFIGEKGKHCWDQEIRCKLEEEREKWDSVVGDINDLSNQSFAKLIDHFAAIVKLPAAQSFRQDNAVWCDILNEQSKLNAIINRFGKLPELHKRVVRNFYIYIVHTFSRKEYKTYTPFVSTTPDFNRARYFAKKGAKLGEDPCVIYVFSRTRDRLLRSADVTGEAQKLSQMGFPKLSRPFFKENEVVFINGIVPHSIYAIHDLDSKVALWNPALFKVADHCAVLKSGFAIDQTGFEVALRQTGYARGIEHSGDTLREFSVI